MNTATLTDLYEFTMLDGFVRGGMAETPTVFELFARRFPAGRRFGMVAGTGRFLEMLEDFNPAGLVDWLVENGTIHASSTETIDYLRNWKFTGDIFGIPEGNLYHPNIPVLTVVAPLGEAVLLETLALSTLNHDTAIASAAARMVIAAEGRPIIEMGSRRTHEQAAVAVSRAAYIAGFSSTSNIEAGVKYGVPVGGTAAHAFTLAHMDEISAFRSQVATQGVGTTLLVDTYDIYQGIVNAVKVSAEFGGVPGGVRIDSGDLDVEARKARSLLDSLGAQETRIVTTSDLDEYVITALADAPIDVYGVGTRVATGSGAPTAEMVYKLVEIDKRPVAKVSASKSTIGGRKYPWVIEPTKDYEVPVIGFSASLEEVPRSAGMLQVPMVVNGEVIHEKDTLRKSRERAAATLAKLSAEDRKIALKNPAK